MDRKLAIGKTREGLRLLAVESNAQFTTELISGIEEAYQNVDLSNERLAHCATSTFKQIAQRPGNIFFRDYSFADPPSREAIWVYGVGAHNRLFTPYPISKGTALAEQPRTDVLTIFSSSLTLTPDRCELHNQMLFTLFTFHCIQRYIERCDLDFDEFLKAIQYIVIISPLLFSRLTPVRAKFLPLAIPVEDALLLGYQVRKSIPTDLTETHLLVNREGRHTLPTTSPSVNHDAYLGVFTTTIDTNLLREKQLSVRQSITQLFEVYLPSLMTVGLSFMMGRDELDVLAASLNKVEEFFREYFKILDSDEYARYVVTPALRERT